MRATPRPAPRVAPATRATFPLSGFIAVLPGSGKRVETRNVLAVHVGEAVRAGQVGDEMDLAGLLQYVRVRRQGRDGPAEVLGGFAAVEPEELLHLLGFDAPQHALGP